VGGVEATRPTPAAPTPATFTPQIPTAPTPTAPAPAPPLLSSPNLSSAVSSPPSAYLGLSHDLCGTIIVITLTISFVAYLSSAVSTPSPSSYLSACMMSCTLSLSSFSSESFTGWVLAPEHDVSQSIFRAGLGGAGTGAIGEPGRPRCPTTNIVVGGVSFRNLREAQSDRCPPMFDR